MSTPSPGQGQGGFGGFGDAGSSQGGHGPRPDHLGLPAQPGYGRPSDTGISAGGGQLPPPTSPPRVPVPPPPGPPGPPPGPPPGGPGGWQQGPGGWQGPGGGQQGQSDWQQLPPELITTLHRPGIVPLRPLNLSDIFSGALQTMRRNPGATIGMAFVVLGILLVPSLLGSLALTQVANLTTEDTMAASVVINLVFGGLASVALTGMIIYVVSEAVLGDRADLQTTWRAVRGRIPALVGSILLISVLFIALLILFILTAGGAIAVAAAADSPALAVLAIVVATLGLTVLMVWAGCRVGLAPAPVVLEKAGPWRAIVRAWSLTRGGQGWRVVGITVLAGIVASLFSTMVQLPVSFVVLLGLEGVLGPLSPVSPALMVTDHLVQLLVQAFTIPFTAGVAALLYLDQRIRREGLDVTLTHAAQARAAARAR